MEKYRVIKKLSEIFDTVGITSVEVRIAFAVGYMIENDGLTRRDALEIIHEIQMRKI